MSKFTHLHSHSHFSLLNALPKIPEIIKKAKADNQTAIALTDDGAMYGNIFFYEECKKNDIKPIMGVDFYVAIRTRFDKQPRIDNKRYRLVLLAKNQQGYRNLMKLVSLSFIDGYYYKPRIDKELIEKYKEGLVAILPQFSAETSGHLTLNNKIKANEAYDFYKKVFGDDLYFEIISHPEIEGQEELKEKIVNYCREKKQKFVATSDFYYLEPEDKKARDVLSDVSNTGIKSHREQEDFSMKTEKEMLEIFKDYPEAIANTKEIEQKCNVEIELGVWHFPELEEHEGVSYDQRLKNWCYEGLKNKGLDQDKEAKKRLDYELDVIKTKGFSAYFLIVADFLKTAKDKNILTNIRGSVAGSLVTYVTGITHLNPFEYKLPFERFLNPQRPSAPDIDMDFASDGRDEMIDYAREKYGKNKVAQIGTFGTMAARGSVKDATRAMGYEYQIGDKIAKLIPVGKQGRTMYIKDALELEPQLKELYESDENVKKIIQMAQKIEGSARHISVHAAGVVIAPDELTYYTPLQVDQKTGKLITQYEMHSVGEDGAGLIKFDFLGINILTTIAETLRRIKKIHGEDIDIQEIPIDDKKTFKMLSAGFTAGCFQLSSEGMTKWLKELKPHTIHDINAMVALYRPGAMSFIPEYIRRKENPNLVKYIDPRMEEHLVDSFGLMVYQDDVMMMAIVLAGYTWLEADKFRKAMGKKIPELMAEQEEKFKKGAKEGGMDTRTINHLWDEIVEFAQYGFNKAHAASYGRVAYQTAYLKANYPAEYMSALMTTNQGDTDKINAFVTECKKMKIPVLQPDVNLSFEDFGALKKNTELNQTDKDQIRFGLNTVKNIGDAISENIVEERKKNGLYKSLEDFLQRNSKHKDLSKKSLEALALSGALDSLADRNEVLANVDNLLEFIKDSRTKDDSQTSLFASLEGSGDMTTLKLQNPEGVKIVLKTGMNNDIEYTLPMNDKEKLFWEKELLGIYITSHPLEKYREKMSQPGKNILSTKQLGSCSNKVLAGVVEEIKEITTKKGDRMAFLKISDFSDSIEVVVFPKVYKEISDILHLNDIYAFKGKIEKKEDTYTMLLDAVKVLK
ncbi:DNA polymerase III subunit alpha [Candidatus Campbellbacteria bacterium]|nr:MAG: DNA polymerase III subunit alpha [Candidatus Campbellbacteria bacterium]